MKVFLQDIESQNSRGRRKSNPGDYYVGKVWPGNVHYVDYFHPNASKFWESQLDRLYTDIKFSGIWLDMNEPSNF